MKKRKLRLLGIYGDPIDHSLSPLLFDDALTRAEIDAVYLPFRITKDDLQAAIEAIRLLDFWGMTITTPHKEAVVPFLDEVDSAAKLIGAVNCIENRNGLLRGYNTDSLGFLRVLKDMQFDPKGKRVMLLGAGGAARAAVVALAREGAAEIDLFNRTPERAVHVAEIIKDTYPETGVSVHALSPEELDRCVACADLISNTSSVGFRGEDFDYFPLEQVAKKTLFCDWVYRRGGTPWLNRIRSAGYIGADGLDVLVGQAKEAFCLWTGREIPEGSFDLSFLREEYSVVNDKVASHGNSL